MRPPARPLELPPRLDELLRLVRVGAGIAGAEGAGPVDAAGVDLAVRHRVVAEVAAAAGVVGIHEDATARLAEAQRAQTLRGMRSVVGTRLAVESMAGAGVEALVVKGVALAAQTGREPRERVSGDVDLLIRPGDWLDADRALAGSGFQPDTTFWPPIGSDVRSRVLRATYYERSYVSNGLVVDLHWRLTPGRPAGLDTAAVMARAVEVEIDGLVALTLDPDTALAHSALHAAKDGWPRLSSVVDLWLLVEVAGASWARADALVPDGPALAEARAAVALLERAGSPAGGDAVVRWVEGIGREVDPDSSRPPGGWVRHLRRVYALTPGWRSAATIVASHVVSPPSLARSPMPSSLWWLEVLVRRPFRVAWVGITGRRRR